MGFVPANAKPDIWMRRQQYHWKYIAVYVDDLSIASKDPVPIIKTLQDD